MLNRTEYACVFGPDAKNQYVESIVESNVATNCGDFCNCTGFTNNKCLFGPDQTGYNFWFDDAVPSELVDSCRNDMGCVCDKQADIIEKMGVENKTFE